MLKELPGELNRKLKRVQYSRDNLKESNREKSQQNKKLLGRNIEITESRDLWKSRCRDLEKALERQKEELRQQIEAANKSVEEEKMRAQKAHECAELLKVEIEGIKKKSKY